MRKTFKTLVDTPLAEVEVSARLRLFERQRVNAALLKVAVLCALVAFYLFTDVSNSPELTVRIAPDRVERQRNDESRVAARVDDYQTIASAEPLKRWYEQLRAGVDGNSGRTRLRKESHDEPRPTLRQRRPGIEPTSVGLNELAVNRMALSKTNPVLTSDSFEYPDGSKLIKVSTGYYRFVQAGERTAH